MILVITLVTILQTMAISLGVGSSTLAIVNFFVAIADGSIDETERKMMGIVYIVLRVAMVLILVTTIFLLYLKYTTIGESALTGFSIAQIIIILILFINAILMTARLMPSTFGPAIQAGNWYSLGALTSLNILGYINFSILQFLLGFLTWLILAVGIVNGIMSILKAKRHN